MLDIKSLEFRLLNIDEMAAASAGQTRWLWHRYLAGGMVTLLTSRWKAGKTTLISVLFRKMAAGGELAGAAVAAGRAVIVSEEPPAVWMDRHQRLGFADNVRWICRPFRGRPSADQWSELVQRLADDGPDLIVIDPLALVLPGMVENNASALLAALQSLHWLTQRGSAILLIHHPRKSGPADELSPRGSGALSAFADILMQLDCVAGLPADSRHRRIRCTSRLLGPSVCTIELNSEATDYRVAPDADPDGFEAGWPTLKILFEDACERLTRKAILKQWPEDHGKPSLATLWRWLDCGMAAGLIERKGAGTRFDPYRYAVVGHQDLLPDLPPLEPLRLYERTQAEYIREADAAAEAMQKEIQKRRAARQVSKPAVDRQDCRGVIADFEEGLYEGE